jgi:tetratricopeptide (TPR) repeat protein
MDRGRRPARRNALGAINMHWLLLGGVILLGTALRFYGLGDKSLWLDEMRTVALFVRRPIAYIVTHFHTNNHILFSFLARLFTQGEYNDFLLRMPAALLGIAAIPTLYSLGRIVFTPSTGVIAAFLLAISPYHLRYSQEARGYTGMVLFTLLCILFWLQAIRLEQRRYLVGFVLATALAIYAHLFSVFLLGAVLCILGGHILGKALLERRGGPATLAALRPWATGLLVLGLVVAALHAPLWMAFLSIVDKAHAGDYMSSMVYKTDWTFDVSSFQKLVLRFGGSWNGDWQAGAAILSGLFCLGLVASLVQRRGASCTLVPLLAVPFLLVAAVAKVWDGFYVYSRFFIFILPLYLLFAAWGVTTIGVLLRRLAGRRANLVRVAVAVTLVVSLGVMSIGSLRTHYAAEPQNWPDAAMLLRQHVQSEDQVFSWKWAWRALLYYQPSLQGIDVHTLYEYNKEDLQREMSKASGRVWYVRDRVRWQDRELFEDWASASATVTVDLGSVFLSLWHKGGASSEELQAERQSLMEAAVTLYPTFRASIDLGDLYLEQNRVSEAVVQYRQAVELGPGLGMGHTKLGNAYRHQGNTEQAALAYEQSIRVDPEYIGAYMNLGGIHEMHGREDEALALYRAAVDIAPDSAWAHAGLGRIYVKLGEPAEGLRHLEQSVELEPDRVLWLMGLANAYNELGQHDKAVTAYRQILILDPGNFRAAEALEALVP